VATISNLWIKKLPFFSAGLKVLCFSDLVQVEKKEAVVLSRR